MLVMRAGDEFVKKGGVKCPLHQEQQPMKRVRQSLGLVVCLLISLVAAPEQTGFAQAAENKRARTFVDAIEQPIVGDPQLSPDGKQILFTIDKADWKANRRAGHIYRINADRTSQVQLTFGERGESSPRWSPDGRLIAFTTRRDPDTSNQIYLLSVEGGEARRLTNHPTATGNVNWAPDSKSLYFVAADAKSADERERDRVQDDVYAFEENNFKQRH